MDVTSNDIISPAFTSFVHPVNVASELKDWAVSFGGDPPTIDVVGGYVVVGLTFTLNVKSPTAISAIRVQVSIVALNGSLIRPFNPTVIVPERVTPRLTISIPLAGPGIASVSNHNSVSGVDGSKGPTNT